MQQPANLEQAISYISQILSQYRGTLQEHQAIQNAFKLIAEKAQEPKVEFKADSIEENPNN
jgi:hypothetical protein